MERHFESYIFFDVETTGLIRSKDPEQFPYITEIALLLVGREELKKAVEDMDEKAKKASKSSKDQNAVIQDWELRVDVPGARKFFSNCNPINMTEEKWTAYGQNDFPTFKRLTRQFLTMSDKQTFAQVWPEIRVFINAAPKPCCIVAHNGEKFDFRILLAELIRVDDPNEDRIWIDQVYGLDSLKMIQSLDKVAMARFTTALRAPDSDSLSTLLKKLAGVVDEIRSQIGGICANIDEPPSTRRRISLDKLQTIFDVSKATQQSDQTENDDENEKAPKGRFKQETIYNDIFRSNFDAHKADEDCAALLQICLSYGRNFVQYAEANAKEFEECLNGPLPHKLRDFISEPMKEKETISLPGIGPFFADKLQRLGIMKATQLRDLFVKLDKNQDRMVKWLEENIGIQRDNAEAAADALYRYARKYPST